jgi:hypothetical protein
MEPEGLALLFKTVFWKIPSWLDAQAIKEENNIRRLFIGPQYPGFF